MSQYTMLLLELLREYNKAVVGTGFIYILRGNDIVLKERV